MRALILRKEVFLYGMAGLCFGFATVSIANSQPAMEKTSPRGVINPPPDTSVIAATGIIEPSSDTIRIIPEIEGRVSAVYIKTGDFVEKGQVLYTLDDSILTANANEAYAAVSLAQSELSLEEARVQSHQTIVEGLHFTHQQLLNRVDRFRPLLPDAISPDEFEDLVTKANDAYYKLRTANTDLNTAKQTLTVARKKLDLAKQKSVIANARHELTNLRSPIDAFVLSVNVRPGDVFRAPLDPGLSVSIGNTEQLHVRAQVSDTEIARFRPEGKAIAYIRNAESAPLPLQFLSYDSVLTDKTTTSNAAAEVIDTRNLNVLYKINMKPSQLYVGQLVDVYIETDSVSVSGVHQNLPRVTPARAPDRPIGASTASYPGHKNGNSETGTRLRQ